MFQILNLSNKKIMRKVKFFGMLQTLFSTSDKISVQS